MESSEPREQPSRIQRLGRGVSHIIHEVLLDLGHMHEGFAASNQGEAKLRASAQPAEYMDIPDSARSLTE